MTTWVIFSVMLVYILLREIMHGRERKDLYDRLMSRDINDYRDLRDKTGPPKPIENIIKKNMRG